MVFCQYHKIVIVEFLLPFSYHHSNKICYAVTDYVAMINFIFLSIFSPRHLQFSITLSIFQYVLCPSRIRNLPAIFRLFLSFLKSRSLILLSNGTKLSCVNNRWFSLYFESLFNRVSYSSLAYWDAVLLFFITPLNDFIIFLFICLYFRQIKPFVF